MRVIKTNDRILFIAHIFVHFSNVCIIDNVLSHCNGALSQKFSKFPFLFGHVLRNACNNYDKFVFDFGKFFFHSDFRGKLKFKQKQYNIIIFNNFLVLES